MIAVTLALEGRAGYRRGKSFKEWFRMTDSSLHLKRIRLNLARSAEFPAGSPNHGYEFVAPLDHESHIDAEAWRKARDRCQVRRFWASEQEEIGKLVHKPGGAEHARWVFDYDESADEDDEAGYRFGAHAFRIGEYVSIRDEDGEMHTFQVVSVEPA
jgi:hypothetical protein